jgi:hypothetical protein
MLLNPASRGLLNCLVCFLIRKITGSEFREEIILKLPSFASDGFAGVLLLPATVAVPVKSKHLTTAVKPVSRPFHLVPPILTFSFSRRSRSFSSQ